MGLISHIRSRRIISQRDERAIGYAQATGTDAMAAWQLARLNENWEYQQRTIPAYIDLVKSGRAPERFRSIEEFVERVPPTTKRMVQTEMSRMSDPTRPSDFSFTTGGSTGEPTTFPFWKEEAANSIPDRWLGRSWYGVEPHDKLFMIWGHSHLLGTGFKGKVNARLRVIKDSLLGYYRFSAYQLDTAKLRYACDEMLRYRPKYMICYSSALDYFCRANEDRAPELKALGLKMALGTGESFPFDDSPQWVNKVLGCKCCMEYGSVETGVMGYAAPVERGLGGFDLFWRSYLFEPGEPGPTGGRVLRVTSLFPKKFPLIRYEIGDEVTLEAGDGGPTLRRVSRIVGKSLSFVTLSDGTKVHSVAFEHSVRTVPGVQRFQVVSRAGEITLKVVAPGADQAAVIKAIHVVMHKIHPSLATAHIEFTDTLVQTVAGKTPMVVIEGSHLSAAESRRAG
jgi:phenylacetate-CoA ligase